MAVLRKFTEQEALNAAVSGVWDIKTSHTSGESTSSASYQGESRVTTPGSISYPLTVKFLKADIPDKADEDSTALVHVKKGLDSIPYTTISGSYTSNDGSSLNVVLQSGAALTPGEDILIGMNFSQDDDQHVDVSGYSSILVHCSNLSGNHIKFNFSKSQQDTSDSNDLKLAANTLYSIVIPRGLGSTIYFNYKSTGSNTEVEIALT